MDLRRVLPDELLAGLSDFVAQSIGLYFPRERWRDLERGIEAAARELGLPGAEACARALLRTPVTHARLEVLASCLTVGETYFFREKNGWAALEEHILPPLLQARRRTGRRLRLWSAGCCTGEEPYSLAILLDRLIPDFDEWNVTILATDVNPRFLRRAAEGVYSEWSFRDMPAGIRERYFTRRHDGRHELQSRIRRRVTFSTLNLADDSFPSIKTNTSAMDVILCRNVLMYFNAERVQQVAAQFHRALLSGGWLIVSPTEASLTLFAPFATVHVSGALLYHNADVAMASPTANGLPGTAPPVPGVPVLVAEPEQLPQGVPELEFAPSRTQDDPRQQANAARRCAGEGRLDEAIAWCEKALAADRLNPAHHYLLAIIRQEQGQLDAAAQSFVHALYLDPDFALAHFALGNLDRVQGRHKEADRHLAAALAVLESCAADEMLPEADGLTAGRLVEIIRATRASRPRAAT